jgi:hypothetical protein
MNADTQTPGPQPGRTQATRSEARESSSVAMIVHPATGEVFDELTLEREPPENVADLLLALREHMALVRRAEGLVTAELERRLATRKRSKWVVGDYEVARATRNARQWDGQQLEQVLGELVEQGIVSASEVADVVEHTVKVHGSQANRLQAQLIGDAQRAVDDCWHWERKPGGVSVTRSIELVALDEHQV